MASMSTKLHLNLSQNRSKLVELNHYFGRDSSTVWPKSNLSVGVLRNESMIAWASLWDARPSLQYSYSTVQVSSSSKNVKMNDVCRKIAPFSTLPRGGAVAGGRCWLVVGCQQLIGQLRTEPPSCKILRGVVLLLGGHLFVHYRRCPLYGGRQACFCAEGVRR